MRSQASVLYHGSFFNAQTTGRETAYPPSSLWWITSYNRAGE